MRTDYVRTHGRSQLSDVMASTPDREQFTQKLPFAGLIVRAALRNFPDREYEPDLPLVPPVSDVTDLRGDSNLLDWPDEDFDMDDPRSS